MIDNARLWIILSELKEWAHKPQFLSNFPWRLINGKYLMLIWARFRLKNKPGKKDLRLWRFKLLDCIPLVLRNSWRLWREWWCRMIRKSSITTISTTGPTVRHSTLWKTRVINCLSGVSLMKNSAKRMWLQFAGTLDTTIYSQWDWARMIS